MLRAFDVAQLAGVGLCRQRERTHHLHALDGFGASGPSPTAQLTPSIRSRPLSSSGAKRSGGVPSSVLPSSSVVICATIGRSKIDHASMAAPISFRSRKRLEDEQVDAPPSSSACACSQMLAGFVDARVLPPTARCGCRADQWLPATLRSIACRTTRDLRPGDVDLAALVGKAEGRELDAVAPKVLVSGCRRRRARIRRAPLRPAAPASGSSRRSLVDEHAARSRASCPWPPSQTRTRSQCPDGNHYVSSLSQQERRRR